MATDGLIIPDVGAGESADLDEDEYRRILRADLDGNEKAAVFLGLDVEGWHQGLQEFAQDIEGQFSKRKAESLAFQNECYQRAGGKQEWFAYKVEYDQWRAAANHVKRLATARLREVREMLKEAHKEANPQWDRARLGEMLEEILVRLTRIEAQLSSGSGSGPS